MRILLLTLLPAFTACDEFYDEDFEQDLEESRRTNDGGTVAEDISYSSQLSTTDANVPGLEGNVRIDVRDDQVSVDLNVSEIPENIVQLHYSYTNEDCSSLSIAIPNQNTTTRSYNVTETTSVDALENDLRASGASTSDGDIDLEGKSFLVRAFSNLDGIPNPTGTNQITILCGEIGVADSDEDTDLPDNTTTTTGTDGTTGGTDTTTTTGTTGTTDTTGTTTF